MIDINVSYGNWPFHQVGWKSLEELEHHLESCGIQQALVSHVGAVWDPDVEPYNETLIKDTTRLGRVTPIPIVNPAWPAPYDWYKRVSQLVGVRIVPSFHGYRLDDEVIDPLAHYLIEQELVLFIQMRMEDERMQHPLARVDGVPIEEVLSLHARFPALRMICLNAYLPEVRRVALHSRNIGFDTAFCEWHLTIECMLEVLPKEHIYLGTHTPFLYTEAGILKISGSRVEESIKEQLMYGNAARLLEQTYKQS